MKKLAIVTTHPIQYNAPWFKLLASRQNVQIKVFYTWSQSAETVKDKTFGREIKWDIPLLEGYDYEFIQNVSKKPGSYHFFGIDCPALIDKLKNFEADAILFFGWNFKSHLKAIHYFYGKVPVWFRGDSTLLNEKGGIKVKIRRLVLKKVYSYVDKAFYVGDANKAYFLKHGLVESQLKYAPHAIDNDRFYDDVEKNYEIRAEEWRQELGFKPKDLVVVFAGKFEDIKQPQILVKAFLEANKKRIRPLHLILIGNGPIEEQLKLMIEGQDAICILPFQNQTKMPLVYRLGQVFCLPSASETWGLAINEAMACGRPAIVSNKVGCAKDLIVHGKTGFVFDHNKPSELRILLENLDTDGLNQMSALISEKIKDFSFNNIVKTLENNLVGITTANQA